MRGRPAATALTRPRRANTHPNPPQAITLTNACVWPLLNIVNYSSWMPPHLRQLFVNMENLFWLTFLALCQA